MSPNQKSNPFLARISGAAALATLFAFYMVMRPQALHVSDAYAWVNTVATESFDYYFHPHHLIYLTVAWRWSQFVHLVAPSASVWASLAALSAVFGCAGVAATYATLRLVGSARGAAAVGSMLPAFAFGYWFFSSDADMPVISLACVLWAGYFLAKFVTTGEDRCAFWAGVATGLAALFHQTGILFSLGAMVVCLVRWRKTGPAAALLFSSAFIMLVAPWYIIAAWAVLPVFGVGEFIRWLFLFAGEGYGGFSLAGTTRAPFGLARALFGGQMALDVLRGASAGGAMVWIGLAFAAAGLAALSAFGVAAIRRLRELPKAGLVVVAGLMCAFGTYAAFGTYFDPANFEWWTIPSTLLFAAAAVAGLSGRRPATAIALTAIVCMASSNFILEFSYRRQPHCDFLQDAASDVEAITTDRDIVIAPSYLGVLIWHDAPERRVFCPDKMQRLVDERSMKATLEQMAREGRGGARFVIAGADYDSETRQFVDRILAAVPASEQKTLTTIRFFDGGRRFIRTVSQVPVIAVDEAPFVAALRSAEVAPAGRAGSP